MPINRWLSIILCLAFNITYANARVPFHSSLNNIKADTIPKKIIFVQNSPLYLPPSINKTTCDPNFLAGATGGDPKSYIFTSSNPKVAIIDKYTGSIHIVGAGITQITVSEAVNLQTASEFLTVTSIINPSVRISPTNYPSTCFGSSVTFIATASDAGVKPSYQWLINGKSAMPISSDSIFMSSNLATGDTITCALTNNTDSCVTSHTVMSNIATITVHPYITPNVSVTQSPSGTVVSGTPITFSANLTLAPVDSSTYVTNYQWQLNGIPISNATDATYISSCARNNDNFTCIVTPAGVPCLVNPSVTSADQKVTITDENIPITAQITTSANNVYAGTYITFKAELLGNAQAVSYLWQINGIDTNVFTQELGTYALKNNDEVRCVIFTNNGCTQVVTSNVIKLVIYPTPYVEIPNTFTPNGDGINDVWVIKYLELYRYSHVKIYSRYGSLLFHSTGYETPWDGKYNGKEVPTGTYYYIIDLGIHTPPLSGPVTVIR